MREMMRNLFLTVLMLGAVGAGAETAELRDFQQILASGELRVGVSVTPPWVIAGDDGKLLGSEPEMARRIAKDMGLKVNLRRYDWNQMIPALVKGEIDVIVSGMAILPERALEVNFSRPYATSGVAMAANRKLTKDMTNMDALNDPSVRIGSLAGSISESVAQRLFKRAEYMAFADNTDVDKALIDGKIHAFIASNPTPKFLALMYPDAVDVPLNQPLLAFQEGVALRKGDVDLLNYIDAWIVARSADQWIDSTRHYWFDSLAWREQHQ